MKQIWDICKGSSIKKRSEKVATNFNWLLRILKLSKLYIKDAKEYIRKLGGKGHWGETDFGVWDFFLSESISFRGFILQND